MLSEPVRRWPVTAISRDRIDAFRRFRPWMVIRPGQSKTPTGVVGVLKVAQL